MRKAKVQASLRIRAVSPEPLLFAHVSGRPRGHFSQRTRHVSWLRQSSRKVQDCLTKLAFSFFFFSFFFFFFFFSFFPAKTFSLSDKCPVNLSKENNILTTNMPSVLQILILTCKTFQSVWQLSCISRKDFAKTAKGSGMRTDWFDR